MSVSTPRKIYFSFFMFTADLQPKNDEYTKTLVAHLKALSGMGYEGFDLHIATPSPSFIPPGELESYVAAEVESYKGLRKAFDEARLGDVAFTTNVGTTRAFDPTSPYVEQRDQAMIYLKSRVDITKVLGSASIMSGPFLYPYGVFPLTDSGDPIWSDALQKWMAPRYVSAQSPFKDLTEYASSQGVKLAIEPVKSWETPPPNMVSEALDFLDGFDSAPCGVTIDTAQVVMESQGPSVFKKNVRRATEGENRLHYVHISAPDRGRVDDSWIPWSTMLVEIEPCYQGPYLVEIFNAIPPFDSSMRLARPRFWRPGEDDEGPDDLCAYTVAEKALHTLRRELAACAASAPKPEGG